MKKDNRALLRGKLETGGGGGVISGSSRCKIREAPEMVIENRRRMIKSQGKAWGWTDLYRDA